MLKTKDPAYVDIERMLRSLRPLNPSLLRRYLKDIHRELSNEGVGGAFMPLLSFYEYTRVPLFIAEKVFRLFGGEGVGLSLQQFEHGVLRIMNGSFRSLLRQTFDFCDFDGDGRILRSDVKLLLMYFVKFCNSFKNENEIYDESSFDLESGHLLDFYFRSQDNLEYNLYRQIVETKFSDLFYILLVILHKCLPFDEENICFYLEDKRLKEGDASESLSHNQNYSLSEGHSVATKTCSDFTETTAGNSINPETVAGSSGKSKIRIDSNGTGLEKLLPPSTSKVNIIVDDQIFDYALLFQHENLDNLFEKLSLSQNMQNIERNFDCDKSSGSWKNDSESFSFDNNLKRSMPSIASLKSLDSNSNYLNLQKQHIEASDSSSSTGEKLSLFSSQSPNMRDGSLSPYPRFKFYEKFHKFHYENYLYKYDTKKQKMTKVYIVMSNKEMYYFKNSSKSKLKGMHYLKDYITAGDKFIDKENFKVLEGVKYYCISLYINNKQREFFVKRSEDFLQWAEIFKRILKIRSLSEGYEIMSLVHEGKSESIFKAKAMASKEVVSIKMYPKKEIFRNSNAEGINDGNIYNIKAESNNKKLRMMITEREILQFSRHKNIICLLDYFEDLENIYLVTEYLERGNLAKFLSTHREDLSMVDLLRIIFQICEGIQYLHKNGIIHRDIKPQNIVMEKKNLQFSVKLIDFNLSSIASDSERHTQSYGTFHFASPEVLLNKPHNKLTDVWSLGVTMYYVIYGALVFQDEQVVANTIKQENIHIEYPFNIMLSEQENLMLQDLISSCLRKDHSKRLSIGQIMKHQIFMIVNNL
jgi:hypothetical protein